jgi:hypothetical protein
MLPRKLFKGIKLFDGRIYSPGSRVEIEKEEILSSIKFKVHKFNNRPKPENRNRTAIFSCFSEFGSEIVGCLYCIPKLMSDKYLGYYSIAMGWQGRAFLYQHLVDEFWEIEQDCQYLRDYCRAFHHESRNLRRAEKVAKKHHGLMVHANEQSRMAIVDVFPHIQTVKPFAAFPRIQNPQKMMEIAHYLSKPNMVGITARNRRCYGRNLDIGFYEKLIHQLESMGYNPIWLGEKATSHPCPCPHIPNFMESEHAKDLEKTLLLVSQLKFTVQFYTASSRLAALVGTPYIIVESPDQIWGQGQEGIRLNLCTKGDKKLVISHFKSLYEDQPGALKLVERAVREMETGNYKDIIGDVEDIKAIEFMKQQSIDRIGG